MLEGICFCVHVFVCVRVCGWKGAVGCKDVLGLAVVCRWACSILVWECVCRQSDSIVCVHASACVRLKNNP